MFRSFKKPKNNRQIVKATTTAAAAAATTTLITLWHFSRSRKKKREKWKQPFTRQMLLQYAQNILLQHSDYTEIACLTRMTGKEGGRRWKKSCRFRGKIVLFFCKFIIVAFGAPHATAIRDFFCTRPLSLPLSPLLISAQNSRVSRSVVVCCSRVADADEKFATDTTSSSDEEMKCVPYFFKESSW